MEIYTRANLISLYYLCLLISIISVSTIYSFPIERYSRFVNIFFRSLHGELPSPHNNIPITPNFNISISNIKSFTPLLNDSFISEFSFNHFNVSNITMTFIMDLHAELGNSGNPSVGLKSNILYEISFNNILFDIHNKVTAELKEISYTYDDDVVVQLSKSISIFSYLNSLIQEKDFNKLIINEVISNQIQFLLSSEINLINIDAYILFEQLTQSLINIQIDPSVSPETNPKNFTLNYIDIMSYNARTYLDSNTVAFENVDFYITVEKNNQQHTSSQGIIEVKYLNISYSDISVDLDKVSYDLVSFRDRVLGKYLFTEVIMKTFDKVHLNYYDG